MILDIQGRQSVMLKIRINTKKLYFLVLFLLPIGFSGIGLGSLPGLRGNVSVSDIFFLLLVPCTFLNRSLLTNKSELQHNIERRVLIFEISFFFLALLSIWNHLRFSFGSYSTSVRYLFKLLVCLAYGYVYMLFLRSCSQDDWEAFVTVAAMSAFVFSLSCLYGVLMYFLGRRTVFLISYSRSFRATGFQEDPNLAAIFQLMSISYVMIWMRFSKKKRFFKLAVLLCVLLGALVTVSKACIITLVLCTFSILVLSLTGRNDKLSFRILLLIIAGIIVVFFLGTKTRILRIWTARLASLFSGDSGEALTGRNVLWQAALGILNNNPLNILFGIGIGQYEKTAMYYGMTTTSPSTHNTLLSFWVECGLMLPLLIILLLIRLLYILAKRAINKKDGFSINAFFGLFAIAVFMNSLNFQNNRMAYVYIVFVVVSLMRIKAGEIRLPAHESRRDVTITHKLTERTER